MVRELLRELHIGYRSFAGTGTVIILFIGALLALYTVFGKKRPQIRAMALSVLGVISFVIASVTDHALSVRTKRKSLKAAVPVFVAMICLFTIVSSGGSVYSREDAVRSENGFHIPEDFVTAAEYITEMSDHATVLVMPGWGPYFESYSSEYELAYREPSDGKPDSLGEDEWILYTQLSTVHPDMVKVAYAARRKGCDYVVLSNGIWPEVSITQCGYERVLELDTCSVYREVKASL